MCSDCSVSRSAALGMRSRDSGTRDAVIWYPSSASLANTCKHDCNPSIIAPLRWHQLPSSPPSVTRTGTERAHVHGNHYIHRCYLLGGGDARVDIAAAPRRRLPERQQIRFLMRFVLLQQANGDIVTVVVAQQMQL